jgi:hypothetical protein
MKNYITYIIIILYTYTLQADTMTTGNKIYNGILQEFKGNNFIFQTDNYKTVKKPRTNVKKITFEKPYNVTYTEKGITHTAKLIKYEKSNFFFKEKGKKEYKIYGGTIKNLKIEQRSIFAPNGNTTPTLKTKYSIKELASLENLSISQKTAINNYVTARKAYIQFQKESNAMIKQRDQLKGKQREIMMNKLQLRKNAEQPLINKLKASINQLEQEFTPK